MLYYCLKCGEELRGLRVWDNFEEATHHIEYFCQNKECSELEKRVDPFKQKDKKIKELKSRLEVIEKALGIV